MFTKRLMTAIAVILGLAVAPAAAADTDEQALIRQDIMAPKHWFLLDGPQKTCVEARRDAMSRRLNAVTPLGAIDLAKKDQIRYVLDVLRDDVQDIIAVQISIKLQGKPISVFYFTTRGLCELAAKTL